MATLYTLTEVVRCVFTTVGQCRTVTFGNRSDYDLNRQPILPILHMTPQTIEEDGPVTRVTLNIGMYDLVDSNKENRLTQPDPFYGTDNLQDIFANLHIAFSRSLNQFRRGGQFSNLWQIEGAVTLNAVYDAGKDMLAGYEASVTFVMPSPTTTDCLEAGCEFPQPWTDDCADCGDDPNNFCMPISAYNTWAEAVAAGAFNHQYKLVFIAVDETKGGTPTWYLHTGLGTTQWMAQVQNIIQP